jgi:hypothetical protein
MKNNILMILAIFLFGCGTFKKSLNKSKETEVTNIMSDVSATRTITETVNTLVEVPGGEISTVADLETLLHYGIIEAENKDLFVSVRLDPASKRIQARAESKRRAVPVRIDKRTEEVIHEKTKRQVNKQASQKHVNKKAETGINWLWLLLLIALLGWYLYRTLFR